MAISNAGRKSLTRTVAAYRSACHRAAQAIEEVLENVSIEGISESERQFEEVTREARLALREIREGLESGEIVHG